MKLLLCNDIHLDDRKPAKWVEDFDVIQFTTVTKLLDRASEEGCGAILCAGDMFNRPNVSRKLISVMQSALYSSSVPFYVVPGQHDLLFRNYGNLEDTALGVLASSRLITILNPDVKVGFEDCYVYGAGWGQKIPVPDEVGSHNILVTHHSVGSGKLFSGMGMTLAKDFLKEHKFDLIVCGDYHYPFHVKVKNKRTKKIRQIVNCGALMRRSVDEKDIFPTVGIYDTEGRSVTFKRIMTPPDVFGEVEESEDVSSPMVDKVLENLRGVKTLSTDYKERVLAYLTSQKGVSEEVIHKVSELLTQAEEASGA